MTFRPIIRSLPFAALLLAGCAIQDSHIATGAQKRLIGMNEVDLEACLGSPDQHSSFGDTDVVTYEFNSTSSTTWSLPIIQGPSFSNGGNCRMTIRFDDRVADNILYSGEKNGTAAPNSFCAPIVRTCLARLNALAAERGAAVGAAPGMVRPLPSSGAEQSSSGT